jgi:hypothetical protein
MKNYDVDLNQVYSFNLGVKSAETFVWGDDNHLFGVADGKLKIIDFDGSNKLAIGDYVVENRAYFTANNKYLVKFVATSKKTNLIVVDLRLLADR